MLRNRLILSRFENAQKIGKMLGIREKVSAQVIDL